MNDTLEDMRASRAGAGVVYQIIGLLVLVAIGGGVILFFAPEQEQEVQIEITAPPLVSDNYPTAPSVDESQFTLHKIEEVEDFSGESQSESSVASISSFDAPQAEQQTNLESTTQGSSNKPIQDGTAEYPVAQKTQKQTTASLEPKPTEDFSANSNQPQWFVQMGAFRSKTNAQNQQQKIRSFPLYSDKTQLRNKRFNNGKIITKVLVGPWKSKKDAQKHQNSMKISLKLDGFVTFE